MIMPRLSVSLEDSQHEWISQTAEEMTVSKGKVVRECINAVCSDSSLFTTGEPAEHDTETDVITHLEERIESIEEQLADQTIASAQDTAEQASEQETAAEPQAQPTTSETQEHQGSETAQERDADQSSAANSTDTSMAEEQTTGTTPSGAATGEVEPDSQTTDSNHEETTSTEASASAAPPSANVVTENESPQKQARARVKELLSGIKTDIEDLSDDAVIALAESEIRSIDKSNPESIRRFIDTIVDNKDLQMTLFMLWSDISKRGTTHERALKLAYEEYPLGHDDADEWWTETVKPKFDLLPGIDPPGPGGSFYRFVY